MKMHGFKIAMFFVALFFAVLIGTPVKAADAIDQYCAMPDGGIGGRFVSSSYQTFKPVYNRMSKATVIASIEGLVDQTIRAEVYKGGTLVATSPSQVVEPTMAMVGLTFDFTDFEVVPNETYKLIVISTGTADWIFVDNSCYTRGEAYMLNNTFGSDYRFTTFGWNYTASNPAPAPSTPSTPSTTIAPPTGVSASVTHNGILVSWTKSTTTDITGYRIFKSDKETTGFVGLGTTDKNAAEFIDTQVTEGQRYYYIVKAYKNNTESASSNTANMAYELTDALPPEEEPKTVTEVKAEDVKQDENKPQETKNLILGLDPALFYFIVVTLVALLAGGGFILYKHKLVKKKALPTVNKGS